MDVRVIGWGGTECIVLAPGRDRCRALVNMIMKF
jgi:hypothetical protein